MSEDCLFCKIVGGQIPADLVYEDERILAFRDISPQAPLHVLIVPRKHVATLNDADEQDRELLGHILLTAKGIAAENGVQGGYRVVNNCGEPAGQSVFHIHFHLLGGRPMGWPPG
jgi:histidine triad (HIT) family protein